jgi:hypothetical protein
MKTHLQRGHRPRVDVTSGCKHWINAEQFGRQPPVYLARPVEPWKLCWTSVIKNLEKPITAKYPKTK